MLKMVNCESYESMSRRCADELLSLVQEYPRAKIVLATGNSPLLAYQLFVKDVLEKAIDVTGITWIELDEWVGLPPENSATCDFFIQKEILSQLHIHPEKYLAFRPMGKDLEAECRRMEEELLQLGRIDAAIVGIGCNGHVGLNEPGEELFAGVHVAKLDQKTKGHAMLAQAGEKVQYGITLGMGNILSAEKLIVLVTGDGKMAAYKRMLQQKCTTAVPATFLHLHNNALCLTDQGIMKALTGNGELL